MIILLLLLSQSIGSFASEIAAAQAYDLHVIGNTSDTPTIQRLVNFPEDYAITKTTTSFSLRSTSAPRIESAERGGEDEVATRVDSRGAPRATPSPRVYGSTLEGVRWDNVQHQWHAECNVEGVKDLGFWESELEAAQAVDAHVLRSMSSFIISGRILGRSSGGRSNYIGGECNITL